MKKLLSSGKNNTKTAKNSMETYYLSLQPVKQNSMNENLCKFSTKECRTACLQFTGRQSFSNVVSSRSRKTEMFVTQRKEFLEALWKELKDLGKCAVRLNLLSDVDWELEFLKIDKKLSELSDIQFYDYTKDHFKIYTTSKNYHLTLSYSGYNWMHCKQALEKGINVAVVFKGEIPLTYEGFEVVKGDESDERFLDRKGVIVGLRYKTPKGVSYEKNKFVVEV